MHIETYLCDSCRGEIDRYRDIRLSISKELMQSAEESAYVDFCSVQCLMNFTSQLAPARA